MPDKMNRNYLIEFNIELPLDLAGGKKSNQLPQIHWDHSTHARLDHGDAIDNICAGHGALVMGHDDKLALMAELLDDLVELVNIGIVKRGIHLIENTERSRLQQVNGEE